MGTRRTLSLAVVLAALSGAFLQSCKLFEHGPTCSTGETACGSTCCQPGVPCGDDTCGCGSSQTVCGDSCCDSDQVCQNGTTCYSKHADLFVYMCPDLEQNGCEPSYFYVNGTCMPITNSFQAGACFDTGITVQGGESVTMSSCTTCPGDCGSAITTVMPDLFPGTTYYIGQFYCQAECDFAPTCGGQPVGQ